MTLPLSYSRQKGHLPYFFVSFFPNFAAIIRAIITFIRKFHPQVSFHMFNRQLKSEILLWNINSLDINIAARLAKNINEIVSKNIFILFIYINYTGQESVDILYSETNFVLAESEYIDIITRNFEPYIAVIEVPYPFFLNLL